MTLLKATILVGTATYANAVFPFDWPAAFSMLIVCLEYASLPKSSPIAANCAGCSVRDVSLCGALLDDELAALNGIGRRHKLGRGDTMMWAGEASRHCGNLLSGVLKLSAALPDGREQIVGLLYPSDFIGRPFAEAIEFSVSALTPSEVCMFPREPFEQILQDHPKMERLLLQRTLSSLTEARYRILMMGRASAREKVLAFLVDTALRARSRCPGTPPNALKFELPLTRGEIADLLGLTIETVSRQLADLRSSGLVKLEGARSVIVDDLALLTAQLDHKPA